MTFRSKRMIHALKASLSKSILAPVALFVFLRTALANANL
jgi:hypothetical protein